jgi:hypothetical protein
MNGDEDGLTAGFGGFTLCEKRAKEQSHWAPAQGQSSP